MAYIAVQSSSSETHPSPECNDDELHYERETKRARHETIHFGNAVSQSEDMEKVEGLCADTNITCGIAETRRSKKAKKAIKKAKKKAKKAKKAKKLKRQKLPSSLTSTCSGADIEVLSSQPELSGESGSAPESASVLDAQQELSADLLCHADKDSELHRSIVQVQPLQATQADVRPRHWQPSIQDVPCIPFRERGERSSQASITSRSLLPPRLSELRNALAKSNSGSNRETAYHSTSSMAVQTPSFPEARRSQVSLGDPVPPGSVLIAISEEAEEALELAGRAAATLASSVVSKGKPPARCSATVHSDGAHLAVPRVPPAISSSGPLQMQRASLPVFAHRSDFLEKLQKHQVVVIEGDTGCGKSTQLPQYVLEDASANQQPCNIIVTQPRRISAVSVAERVAEECGTRCGELVGYSIRLETSSSLATRLLFCTVGVLLRRLESDPTLQGLTHVFVDEVHERSIEIDLLLLALSDIRRHRPKLWIILMSATLESDMLSRYFEGAPRFKIPGRTFPVKTLFLEDALEMTSHVVETYADWASRIRCSSQRYSREVSFSGVALQSVGERKEDLSADVVRDRYYKYSIGVCKALASLEHGAVNYDLAAQVVGHFLKSPAPKGPSGEEVGAILVFLSGAKEIQNLRSALLATVPALSREPACSWILTLHSSLPPDQQRLVFCKPPAGVRKIVLATNIAETSITIDDVGIVVDTAHVKEVRYDVRKRLASLEDVIVSRASARQRRGRAGRVAPGTCVHLVTKYCHDKLLEAHQLPEVQRTSLEQLVLRIHATGLHQGGAAEAACARLLQPPDKHAVRQSVKELVDLGALARDELEGTEELTCLGKLLGDLPLDARMGKLVLLGLAFGRCVFDAVLTVAASLTVGSPLAWSWDHKYEAQRAHRAFAEKLVVGDLSCSDVLAMLEAYQEWDRLERKERAEFCRTQFLRSSALIEISKMRDQLHDVLLGAELLPWPSNRTRPRSCHLSNGHKHLPKANLAPLVTGLLCAALFPQLVIVVPKESLLGDVGAHTRCTPVELFVDTASGQCSNSNNISLTAVQVHPSSVSAREKCFGTPYLVYNRLVQTARLYVYDVTPVPPLTLAIFAGIFSRGTVRMEGRCTKHQSVLAVGSSLRFAMPSSVCKTVLEIRAALDKACRAKLQRDKGQHCHMDKQSLDLCIADVIECLSKVLSIPVS